MLGKFLLTISNLLLLFHILTASEIILPNNNAFIEWQSLQDSSFNDKENFLCSFPSELDSTFTLHLLYQLYVMSDNINSALNKSYTFPQFQTIQAKLYALNNEYAISMAIFEKYIANHTNNLHMIAEYIEICSEADSLQRAKLFLGQLSSNNAKNFGLFLYHFYFESFNNALLYYNKVKQIHLPIIYLYYGNLLYEMSEHGPAYRVWDDGLSKCETFKDYQTQLLLSSQSILFSNNKEKLFHHLLNFSKSINDSLTCIQCYQNYAKSCRTATFNETVVNNLITANMGAFIFNKKKLVAKNYLLLIYEYWKNSQYAKADQIYIQMEKICQFNNYKSLLAKLYFARGRTYKETNLNIIASWHLATAIDMIETNNLEEQLTAEYYNGLALLNSVEKHYENAKLYYEKLIDLYPNSPTHQAYYNYQIARDSQRSENFSQAAKYYYKAIQLALVANQPSYVNWYKTRYAEALIIEDNDMAALQTLEGLYPCGNNTLDANIQVLYGIIEIKKQHWKKAEELFETAIKLSENDRNEITAENMRISWLASRIQYYELLAETNFSEYMESQNRDLLPPLLANIENTHARVLKEQIHSKKFKHDFYDRLKEKNGYTIATDSMKVFQHFMRENPSLEDTSNNWNDIISKLYGIRYEVITQKMNLHAQLSDLVNEEEEIYSADDILKRLQSKNSSIIIYHIPEKWQSCIRPNFAVVLNCDAMEVVPLPFAEKDFEENYKNLLEPLHAVNSKSVNDIPFQADAAFWMYEKLFRPIEEHIDLHENIIIIPNAKTANIPFDLLLTRQQNKNIYYPHDVAEYAKDFLIHKYNFSYQPSIMLLNAEKDRNLKQPRILCMANPISELDAKHSTSQLLRDPRVGWKLTPLPFAEQEVKQIKKIAKNSKVLIREQATEKYLKEHAGNYDIIHLSSHAFTDTLFNEFSGIILAMTTDSTDDGILMGYELSEFELPAELVVLSACETGRGQLADGEGVLGLPRQFLTAGTKTVIMSNWKVDDQFTSQLMPEFYKNFINRNKSKSQALRAAKLSVLNEKDTNTPYKHPFFWASFSLYGDVEGKVANQYYFYLVYVLIFGAGFATLFIYKITSRKKQDVNQSKSFYQQHDAL